jgi:hypothetical protein
MGRKCVRVPNTLQCYVACKILLERCYTFEMQGNSFQNPINLQFVGEQITSTMKWKEIKERILCLDSLEYSSLRDFGP